MDLIYTPKSVVAVLLLVATIITWLVFETSAGSIYASLTIIAIGIIKARAIIYSFMDIALMPVVWKYLFNAWLLVVGSVMVATSLATLS